MEEVVMNSKERNLLIYSLVIILIVSCFTGWFYFINEPLNEDLGAYFDHSSGLRITTLHQVLERTKNVYMGWSGRIPGYFLVYISKLFPRYVQAIAVAVVFSANILLTIRIIVKGTLRSLSSPVLFIILYLVLYWYRLSLDVNYRWEFVAIYSVTLTMTLLYYNMAGSRFDNDDSDNNSASKSKRVLFAVLIQLVGIIAGSVMVDKNWNKPV